MHLGFRHYSLRSAIFCDYDDARHSAKTNIAGSSTSNAEIGGCVMQYRSAEARQHELEVVLTVAVILTVLLVFGGAILLKKQFYESTEPKYTSSLKANGETINVSSPEEYVLAQISDRETKVHRWEISGIGSNNYAVKIDFRDKDGTEVEYRGSK